MATSADLSIWQGEDSEIQISGVTDDQGQVVDLATAAAIVFTVKPAPDTTAEALLSLDLDAGIAVAGGVATISIPRLSLAPGRYYYDVLATIGGRSVLLAATAVLTVLAGVTG